MNYQRRQRSIIDSFIEGLIAPWGELALSLTITLGSKVLEAIREAGEVLRQALNITSSSSASLSADLISLFTFAVLVMSIIDLIRNLAVGFLYPAHTIAHMIGELISLLLLFNALLLLSKSIVANCLLAILFLAVGIVLRFYVEHEKSKVEYWRY